MSCAVVNCGSDGENQRAVFFPFPKDPNMCKAWKYACGRSDDFRTDTAVICELHFEKSDYETHVLHYDYSAEGIKQFRQVQLKSYTIPTLNLPKVSGKVSHNVSISKQSYQTAKTYVKEMEELEVAAGSYEKECGVANCSLSSQMVYDFPHYKHQKVLFERWKWICQNENLESLRPEDVGKRYGICEGHFDKDIVILPELLPTKDVPDLKVDPIREAREARQMCRLCFSVGSVDLFSYKYYKIMLKDIVKCFIPIEIRKTDASTVVCENCKCELIRFYNFLLKSLRVNEYFQSMSMEVEEQVDVKQEDDAEVEAYQLIKVEPEEEPLEVEASEELVTLIEILDDKEPKTNDAIVGGEQSLLRQRLTSNQKKVTAPSYSNYVPEYVMKHIHSYTHAKNRRNRKENVSTASKSSGSVKANLDDSDNNRDDIIICIHCNAAIGSLEEFHEHCRLANHAPVARCADCNRMFKTEKELEAHSESHKKNDSCVCDRCGKLFSKRDGLYSHLNTVHNKNQLKYECKECPKKFATNYRLKVHMRMHTNDRPYCCEKCGAVFTLLTNLRNHQTIHTDYKPHVCLICNKGFRRRYKLGVHLTKHTGERKYACEKCGLSYKRKLNLNRHNKRYHQDPSEEPEGTPMGCSLCGFVSMFPMKMRLHMLKEHRSYTCVVCNLTFKNYQQYYNHRFKHNPSKKKFPCKYCNKRFVNGALLKVHMVVHTGQKDFECPLCQKRFSQRPHLQSHLLIHTGEKPHQCKYCPKSFAHLSTLVVHERTHTGETPYVCQFCNKGFGHLTNYKKHVRSQHGVIMPKVRDYSTVIKVEEDANVSDNGGVVV